MHDRRFVTLPVRFASALAAFATWIAPGAAWAGRERIVAEAAATVPATPEPGAALAFGLGVGVVAWVARRRHRNRR